MARISYVNGRYVPHGMAMVHVEDRGYQFSDGVYEVMAFYNRRLLDEDLHMKRLQRSLREMRIAPPMAESSLSMVMAEVIARNDRTDGTLYLQVTRGVAGRDHVFPVKSRPSLVMMVAAAKAPAEEMVRKGVSVITLGDQRWARCDVKSISLLPNVLAKQAAAAAGAREAWLTDAKGRVTEGAVSNCAIITAGGEVITHPKGDAILGGVTRDVVIALARGQGIRVTERPFSVKEAKMAAEAFLTSTTSNILPVVRIDGTPVGSGKPGAITLKLLGLYYRHIRQQTGKQWR